MPTEHRDTVAKRGWGRNRIWRGYPQKWPGPKWKLVAFKTPSNTQRKHTSIASRYALHQSARRTTIIYLSLTHTQNFLRGKGEIWPCRMLDAGYWMQDARWENGWDAEIACNLLWQHISPPLPSAANEAECTSGGMCQIYLNIPDPWHNRSD